MALMTNNGKPIEPQKKAVDESLLKEIMKMLPKEKVEATEPKNALAKIMVEGRADKLLDIVKQIMNTYIEHDTYGNVSASKTKNLVLTFMIEEKNDKKL